ncbi:MAG: DUF58 domain-containing protein [Verrucomicrobiales bacterium]
MPHNLPSIPISEQVHTRCRASGSAAAAVLGDLWTAPNPGRGAGGLLRHDSGESTEFHDQRLYTPGDDTRRINWAAYGRTRQLTLKLFRQEGRPLIDVLLDVSPSMWYPAEKAERTLELLYFILESTTSQQAGLKIWTLSGGVATPLPTSIFSSGSAWIEQVPAQSEGDHPLAPRHLPVRAGSRRILLSDLLFPLEPEHLTGQLAAHNGSAGIFAPWHRIESDPGWRGGCQLDDSESQLEREIEFDEAEHRAYRDAYRRHFGEWQDACRRWTVSLSRIPAEGKLSAALAATPATSSPSRRF